MTKSKVFDIFQFIQQSLSRPCICKGFRRSQLHILCIFPCFCPYEPKQGKFFILRRLLYFETGLSIFVRPFSVRMYTVSQTSEMYFRSWEMLMMAPGNKCSISRIAPPESGEKFRVGSSRISTLFPCSIICSSSIFAF